LARKVSVVKVKKLYSDGFSASSIARLLGVSRQYVSKIVRGLKISDPKVVASYERESERFVRGSRKNVHAQRIRAFVHWAGPKYEQSSNVYFKDFVSGVDVSCQGKFIYCTAKKKFNGETETKALWKSLSFWRDVLSKLESRLGVMIFKGGSQAFEFLYQEWETGDSPVALDAERKGHIWRVFHSEDGKLRLSVDWSDKVPSHETHHKRDSHVDSIVFEKHVNSILDNPSAPTYSELVGLVKDIAVHNRETAVSLTAVSEVLKSQFPKREDVFESVFEKPNYVG